MKVWHTFLAVGAVTSILVAVRTADQRRHEQEIAELRADIVSSSTPAPSRERPPVPVRIASPARPAERTTDVDEQTATDEEPEASLSPEPRAAGAEEVREHMETTFSQERPDPDWARSAQEAARRGIESTLPAASKLRAVECRDSMCRIETAHQDLESCQAFVQATFMDPGTHLWNGGFFATVVPDPRTDELTVVSYLARDGEQLPPPRAMQ